MRVTAAAADNTIARVVKLVEEAQESKAPTERFIDHFSRYYMPGVVAVAAPVAIVPPLLFGGAWYAWIYVTAHSGWASINITNRRKSFRRKPVPLRE